MDSHAPTRPSIWQKRCPTGDRKTCWFSKNRSFYRKEEAEVPGFHSRNCVGKPPSLLRLSSTGDTVDDTSDFSSFEPSNLRGSESNFRGSPKPKPGVLDRIAKFAFSANSSDFKQSMASNFVRESSESMANQVDLSILMEKFDSHQSKMERPGQFMSDTAPAMVHPQQGGGGMRGFVKEGIYHPFARQSPDQVGSARQSHPAPVAAEMQQPAVHAFPLFNISPIWNPYRHQQHPHPYMSRTRFIPEQRPNCTMASGQFWHGTPAPGTAPVTSDASPRHTPLSHVSRHHGCQRTQIRDSAVLRNWIVDPRVRSQFINTESIAARLQGHDATNLQSQHRVHHYAVRNPMMKTRTEMTQQNQNPNKAGCVHTGSTHQEHRHPPYAKTTTSKQSIGSPKQSPIHQSASKCPSEDKAKHQDNKKQKTSDRNSEEKCKVLKLEDTDTPLEPVTDEVKIQAENEQKATNSESQVEKSCNNNMDCDQSMHCLARVTSSVDRVICATAGKAAQNAMGPKSEYNETSRYKNRGPTDTENLIPGDHASNGKSHLLGSQELKQDAVHTQQIQNSRIQESHNSMLEDDGASKSTQSQSCENGDCGLSFSSTSPDSSQDQVQICTFSPRESASSDSPNPKPLHSSLAFLLARTTDRESDYSDSDWDSTGSSPPSDSWDFLKCSDDPYNPLYGWRCAKRSERQDQEQETESKPDDELDSGISSLQAQQDDTVDVSPAASESWDEDEPSLEESTHSAESPCASNDSVNPLISSVCSDVVNTSKASVQDPCTTTDSTVRHSQVQSHVSDNLTASTNLPEFETETSHSSLCEKLKSVNILAPRSIVSEPQKLHPSVLFILGADDSDSDSECEGDNDDFDDCDADSFDNIWSSSQQCPDPYSPLQGWRFHLTIPVVHKSCKNLPAPDQNTTTELSKSIADNENSTSSTETPHQFVAEADPRPTLKRASTTGCLWIPCDGSEPGRPLHNKKVHFCEDSPLVINESPSWSSEYSDSRRGPWQEMARDRCRFGDRIRCTEGQIAHVFAPEHRQRVQVRMQAQVV
ncbi:uncharacterized protein LOC119721189 [Patiria miniata]|uniref:Protein DP71L n=1 Tax=Patiria miniata TaxID=46514 RepID=A0A913Z5M2_PATMI|nr:uncharacterized protein LOC119721189 [Patiria miniata]